MNKLGSFLSVLFGNRSKHLQYGVPFLSVIVVGSFFLRDMQQSARYDNRKVKTLTTEQLEKDFGIKADNLDEDPEKKGQELLQDYLNNDFKKDYQMVRGPRPWEKDTLENNKKIKEQAARNSGVLVQ